MIKGFKAMKKDMTCRDFKFEVGKEYQTESLVICQTGFHFCENLMDVYNYYDKSIDTVVCEVEALGEVKKEGDKSVTNHIKIVRVLTDRELLEAFIKNTNTGYSNTGDLNTGHRNTGDCNTGHYNTGYSNTGNYNTGHRNTNHYNTGNCNTGYSNTGNYNTGDFNTGFFNTDAPTVRLFNKDSGLQFDSEIINKLRNLSIKVKSAVKWIPASEMTDQEKSANPTYKTTGGYLKNNGKFDFSALNNEEDIKFLKSLPNFDAKILKEITGIDTEAPKTIKVNHNGQEFEIDIAKAKELGIIK